MYDDIGLCVNSEKSVKQRTEHFTHVQRYNGPICTVQRMYFLYTHLYSVIETQVHAEIL